MIVNVHVTKLLI